MENKQAKKQKRLKTIGIILLVLGAIEVIVGIISIILSVTIQEMLFLSILLMFGSPTLFAGIILTLIGSLKHGVSDKTIEEQIFNLQDKHQNIKTGNEDYTRMFRTNGKGKDVKICLACGAVNENGDIYCKNCGNQIN